MATWAQTQGRISAGISRCTAGTHSGRATILVYHNISRCSNARGLQPDTVPRTQFEQQLRLLRENDFRVISLRELLMNVRGGICLCPRSVVLTFDDGYQSAYSEAFPLLQEYEFPATFFLTTAFVGTSNVFPWLREGASNRPEDLRPMSWDAVRELSEAGYEIGSHTSTHPFLPGLDRLAMERELLLSHATIGDKTGVAPEAFALPYSHPLRHRLWPAFESNLAAALEMAKYTSCSTLLRGHISEESNPFALNRFAVCGKDDLQSFLSKISYRCAWTRFPQMVYQSVFKRYNI